LPLAAISGQAGIGKGFGAGFGSSGVGIGDASGMGMKTTGVSAVETAFQTKPLPIRSILLYAELVEIEFIR
jgi:hypothetical protein